VHGLNLGYITQTGCPERVRSAPSMPVGRDVPNARNEIFKLNSKTSGDAKSYLDIQSEGDSKAGLSSTSAHETKLESTKFLKGLSGTLKLCGSVGYGLKRSESFERDVCLLFTDAAHKVIDKSI
jgi:hypothetical protein